MTLPSPCVGLCQLDPATGQCLGCARTGAEIAGWRDGTEAFRAAVWAELPRRAAALGLAARRLDWDAEAILGFLETSLRGAGAWTLGFGPAGTFRAGGGAAAAREGATVTAQARGASLRLTVGPLTRAFAAGGGVALALPCPRSTSRQGPRLDRRGAAWRVETPLGHVETRGATPDRAALLPDLPGPWVAAAAWRSP